MGGEQVPSVKDTEGTSSLSEGSRQLARGLDSHQRDIRRPGALTCGPDGSYPEGVHDARHESLDNHAGTGRRDGAEFPVCFDGRIAFADLDQVTLSRFDTGTLGVHYSVFVRMPYLEVGGSGQSGRGRRSLSRRDNARPGRHSLVLQRGKLDQSVESGKPLVDQLATGCLLSRVAAGTGQGSLEGFQMTVVRLLKTTRVG